MTVAYVIIFAISALLPVGYFLFVKPKQSENWLLALYLSVITVNLGYLLLSISKTVEFALLSNKIAYLGQIFVITSMFMIIYKLCGFKYKNWVCGTLISVAILMFGLVCTTGHLDWYYKSVELTTADGATKLVKEYGFLHPLYLIFILGYFIAMLSLIAVSIKKRLTPSHKLAGLMLAVVIGNIGMWLVEKLVSWNFEFLSVSYLMSSFVFLFVYWILQDYVHISRLSYENEEKQSVIVVDSTTRAEKLQSILSKVPNGRTLSSRQLDILEGILDGKSRKEIASHLNISENTVKMHTSALYRILEVSSRDEIFRLFK